MADPKEAARDAAAQARQDPVLFGPDPFAGQPGGPLDGEEPTYAPRPKWPVVAGILILVVLMVVALGIWVF